jgi:hypothetical protein
METLHEVAIRPTILWPKQTPLAALIDLEFQTPDIPLKVPLFELSLSLRKSQVVYVPSHVMEFYLDDPDDAVLNRNAIELGFIQKITSVGAYVRYFLPGGARQLRTTANGEYTMFDDLFFFNHSEPYQIERAWDQIKDQV